MVNTKPTIIQQIENFSKLQNDDYTITTRQWIPEKGNFARLYFNFYDSKTHKYLFELYISSNSNDVYVSGKFEMKTSTLIKYQNFISNLYTIYDYMAEKGK